MLHAIPDPVLAHLRRELTEWHERWQFRCSQYQKFLLALAKCFLSSSSEVVIDTQDPDDILFGLDLSFGDVSVCSDDLDDLLPLDIEKSLSQSCKLNLYGLSFAHSLLQWLRHLYSEADFVQRVTTVELCMGFYFWSSVDLPFECGRNDHPSWYQIQEVRAGETQITLANRHSSFVFLFDELLTCLSLDLEEGSANRPALGLLKEYRTFLIPWPANVQQRVALSLLALTKTRPIRTARDLSRRWP